ncbi:hypothetical protein RHGRI_013754 [Rhododendron griersonianum]|uniref:Uncharacterized protein n=1 Tax=Rhododendron griersonianum TaxID=479676 RepID=A0AAV6K768_9ERIC|nr:hypothetical protein RHGRI_013754 [Rhododendron griersonianum]
MLNLVPNSKSITLFTSGLVTVMLTAPNEKNRPLFAAKDIKAFYLDHHPKIFPQKSAIPLMDREVQRISLEVREIICRIESEIRVCIASWKQIKRTDKKRLLGLQWKIFPELFPDS